MINRGNLIPQDESGNGLAYDEFEEKLPWTWLAVPENPNIALNIRVLHAFVQKNADKPQLRFAVEYLTLWKNGHKPTEEDGHAAYNHALEIVKKYLAEWSDGEDAVAEIVKPTAASIRNCLDGLRRKIADN